MIRIYSTSVGAVSMYSYIVQLYEYRTYTLYTVHCTVAVALLTLFQKS